MLFGWDAASLAEDEQLQDLFRKIDTDGGGTLDLGEIGQLMKTLGLDLTESQITSCFKEMNMADDGEEVRERTGLVVA